MGATVRLPPRPRVIGEDELLRAALAHFVREGTVHMQQLADELAVGRATLYRLVPGREPLLGDVLATLTTRTLRLAEAEATGTGVDRFFAVSGRFRQLVVGFAPLRRFTDAEPELAFRVLFTTTAGVHQRTVAWWAGTFARAQQAGEVALPMPAEELAEMFVRLGETMLWSDLLVGRPVDVAMWTRVQRSLFLPAAGAAVPSAVRAEGTAVSPSPGTSSARC